MALRTRLLVVVSCLVVGIVAPSSLAGETPEAGESDAGAADSGSASGGQPFRAASADRPREPVSEEKRDELVGQLESIASRQLPGSARLGMFVVDVATGQTLYRRNAEDRFNPASNMKLLTSSAALDVFGPSRTFETRIRAVERKGGTIPGNIYVEGAGEAFLLFEDFVSWAGQLQLKGLNTVEGALVVDESIFGGNHLPPGFGKKDEDASYRSPIGALSVNFNSVTAIASPGEELGDPVSVRLYPPTDHIEIDVRAETVAGRARDCIFKSEKTESGGTRIIVEGALGSRASAMRSRLRIDNPPAFAGSVLARSFEMVGLELKGGVRSGKVPPGAETLLTHESKPLSFVVQAMNKWSNNFMAEQLLRLLGTKRKEGPSWKTARAVLRSFLTDEVGIAESPLEIHNGSGLYRGNWVTPQALVRLLTYMLDHRARPEFVSSLAVAGTDGTLEDRMEEGPATGRLRAKTGTLNEVSALSGYVETESGRLLAFSMLLNDTPARAWRYRPAQDEMAQALAGFDG